MKKYYLHHLAMHIWN